MDNKTKIKYLRIGMIVGYTLFVILFIYFFYAMIAGRVTAPLGTEEWREQFNYGYQLNTNMPIFFAIGFVGCIIGNLCYRPYKKLKSGIQGEERTLNILENLPTNYTVLSNIPIEWNGQKSEIDNLILSSKGIIIVETKNYKGIIKGNEEDREWTLDKKSVKGKSYKESIKNPIKQVKRQTYILSQILKSNNINCWIDGYVYMHQVTNYVKTKIVYTHPGNLLQTILSSGKENTLSENDIKNIKRIFSR